MQKRYDTWKEKSQEVRIFYNLKKQSVLTHIHDIEELKRMRRDVFMATVKCGGTLADLALAAPNGDCRRLVAIRGEAVKEGAPCPDFLRQELPEEHLDEAAMEPDRFSDAEA